MKCSHTNAIIHCPEYRFCPNCGEEPTVEEITGKKLPTKVSKKLSTTLLKALITKLEATDFPATKLVVDPCKFDKIVIEPKWLHDQQESYVDGFGEAK